MPERESFFNPYRWVHVPEGAIERGQPTYHHRFQGLAGSIRCRLTALTPLMIAGPRNIGDLHEFITHPRTHEQFIPATSLKGSIRALAEVVGNAAVTHGDRVDSHHQKSQGADEERGDWRLDIVARTFGFLDRSGQVYAGLIQFTDGRLVETPSPRNSWPTYEVQVGQPKPTHTSFYASPLGRKFYHHRAGESGLIERPRSITQFDKVRPMPPDTVFEFDVLFHNLTDGEFDLLVYCLALEEEVTMQLSPQAAGTDPPAPVTLHGPLRHKIGGCKPHGAGSVRIQPTVLSLETDLANRYRPGKSEPPVLQGDALRDEIRRRTERHRNDVSPTMQELRAMLVYDENDPRGAGLQYPTYSWFNEEGNSKRRLKPTL